MLLSVDEMRAVRMLVLRITLRLQSIYLRRSILCRPLRSRELLSIPSSTTVGHRSDRIVDIHRAHCIILIFRRANLGIDMRVSVPTGPRSSISSSYRARLCVRLGWVTLVVVLGRNELISKT